MIFVHRFSQISGALRVRGWESAGHLRAFFFVVNAFV